MFKKFLNDLFKGKDKIPVPTKSENYEHYTAPRNSLRDMQPQPFPETSTKISEDKSHDQKVIDYILSFSVHDWEKRSSHRDFLNNKNNGMSADRISGLEFWFVFKDGIELTRDCSKATRKIIDLHFENVLNTINLQNKIEYKKKIEDIISRDGGK